MGALKYVEELQKKKQSDMMRFLMRVRVRIRPMALHGTLLTLPVLGGMNHASWDTVPG